MTMKLLAIIDWSLSYKTDRLLPIDKTYCPKVTGPKGGKMHMEREMYYDGTLPADYPVPALRMNVRIEPDKVMIEDDWNVIDDFFYRIPFFVPKN